MLSQRTLLRLGNADILNFYRRDSERSEVVIVKGFSLAAAWLNLD